MFFLLFCNLLVYIIIDKSVSNAAGPAVLLDKIIFIYRIQHPSVYCE